MLRDVLEIVRAGQLTVSDIQKVLAASELMEYVPSGDMCLVVVFVTVVCGEVDGHSAVVGQRQDIEELFEIGAVILAVPVAMAAVSLPLRG